MIKGRGTQARRQWQILRMLSVNRMTTLPKIATKFRVSEKTIRRDLEFLEAAGFPILYRADEDEPHLGGYIRLEGEFAEVFRKLPEMPL